MDRLCIPRQIVKYWSPLPVAFHLGHTHVTPLPQVSAGGRVSDGTGPWLKGWPPGTLKHLLRIVASIPFSETGRWPPTSMLRYSAFSKGSITRGRMFSSSRARPAQHLAMEGGTTPDRRRGPPDPHIETERG